MPIDNWLSDRYYGVGSFYEPEPSFSEKEYGFIQSVSGKQATQTYSRYECFECCDHEVYLCGDEDEEDSRRFCPKDGTELQLSLPEPGDKYIE